MKSNRPTPLLGRIAACCAAGAGVLALAGGLSWWCGQWRLLTFGGGHVPMAPSTALLMILLSLAAFLHARPSLNGKLRTLETLCAGLVLGGGAFFGLQHLFGLTVPFEAWLSRTSETVGRIPVGRISPLTAGCFVLSSTALLCGRIAETRWQSLRPVAGLLGLVTLGMSGIILADYAAGSPFLYNRSVFPMALLTGAAFALVSAATLLGAGSEAWPLRMFFRARAFEEGPGGLGVEWPLLRLFLSLAAGITAVGVQYLHHQQAKMRSVAQEGLAAIANLKVQQFENWRQERLLDGAFFSRAPFVAQDVARMLAAPRDANAEADTLAWLTPLKSGQRYERVAIFDSRLNPRLSLPPWTNGIGPLLRAQLTGALSTKAVVMNDLRLGEATNDIHMGVVLPVFAPDRYPPLGGQASTNASLPIAIIVLQIDLRDFLYPLLQTWPTPARTAETFLVRREGDELLFSHDVHQRTGTALKLQFSLDDPQLLAAMGVGRAARVQEGVDYRDVVVLAAVRSVPGTDWLMVTKMDAVELDAPMRQEALTAGALLLTAAFGITLLWRQRNERFLRAQLATEREGRALAQRFEHLMKSASDAILLADEQGRVVEANDRARALYGYSLAELQKLTQTELRAPGHPADLAREAEEMAANGQATFEMWHRRKDGTTFPADISSRVVEIGGRRHSLAIIRDITERKRVEEALRQSEEEFRAIFALASVGMAQADIRTGQWVRVNQKMCAITGYSEAEMLRLQVREVTHPDDRQADWEAFQQVVRGETRDYRREKRYVRKDGSITWVNVNMTVIRDGAGQPLRSMATIEDISGRKQAELERERATENIQLLLESTAEGIYGIDTHGECTFINRAAAAMLGCQPEDARGQDMHLFMHHHRPDGSAYSEAECPISQAFREGRAQRGENEVFWRRDGSSFPARWLANPITKEGVVRGAVVTFSDITREVQLQDQLRQAQKMEAVGQLAGGVAHDFNNILAVILLHVDMTQSEPNVPDEVREGLQQIGAAAERAASLTRQLLLFSRRQVMQPRDLDLNQVVTSLGKMLGRIIGEDVHLRLNLHPAPLMTRADAGMLDQILLNLSVNARDAMPDGGTLVIETSERDISDDEARLVPDATPGHYACLRVNDSGTGIPPEILPRIFEPFFTTKGPGKGTGLGLATVFGIIKQHGGAITVESVVGRGTTFQIFLPAIRASEVTVAGESAKPKPRGGTETILLVEDEPSVRILTRAVLERHGYSVLEAAQGVEALRLWDEHAGTIHLLLTDIVMPGGISGRELAVRLGEHNPQLRVIFTSGYSAEIAGREPVLRKGQEFIQKPCAQAELLQTVRRCLDG